jgi:hypothetical protein
MFPFRLYRVFTNRWMAVLWAAGICWMAVDFTSSETPADANASADNQSASSSSAAEEMGYNKAQLAQMQNQLRSW